MKKALYIILLVVESLAALISLAALSSTISWFGSLAVAAVTAVPLVWQIKRLKAQEVAEDAATRKKVLRRIALILLIPTVLALAGAVYVIVSLFLYFG